ncbi:ribonuclease III domain-containing protein [Acholeplasma hippikon]|uniref:Ribonuclease III n=1 Tax=Acholeplasma hippikon TaxID=264636 RepID=A0A449BLD4_9MOLU|nr:ribonuclease III domain-containing protein [Acholeplasma hippikon]VEU83251.1 ribonuclease III [Acholeplasma hippikon]
MDKFEYYLNLNNEYIKLALNPSINKNLATLGDSVLKLALADLLYGKVKYLSEHIKFYNTDRTLVEDIGKHYQILNYIRKEELEEVHHDYAYIKKGKNKSNPKKYIATAIEALLGAIYLINNQTMDEVKAVILHFKKIIDK